MLREQHVEMRKKTKELRKSSFVSPPSQRGRYVHSKPPSIYREAGDDQLGWMLPQTST
jgi:hypothetical protein